MKKLWGTVKGAIGKSTPFDGLVGSIKPLIKDRVVTPQSEPWRMGEELFGASTAYSTYRRSLSVKEGEGFLAKTICNNLPEKLQGQETEFTVGKLIRHFERSHVNPAFREEAVNGFGRLLMQSRQQGRTFQTMDPELSGTAAQAMQGYIDALGYRDRIEIEPYILKELTDHMLSDMSEQLDGLPYEESDRNVFYNLVKHCLDTQASGFVHNAGTAPG